MWSKLIGCFRLASSLNAFVPTFSVPMKIIYPYPKRCRKFALGVTDQNEIAQLQTFLERHGCSMTYMSDRGGYYLVRLPDGTTEYRPEDRDARYQDQTILKLPNGIELTKVVHWPCMHRTTCNHTRILLPDEAKRRGRGYA
jgi:hypothetical protein